MPDPIPLIRPDLNFDEIAPDLAAIVQSGILTRGLYVSRFEAAVAAYVGNRHAVATTSATTALHLCLVAAGIGPGDEVLVSDFTFPASGNVIVQCGATPVLIDCLLGRYEFSPDHLRQCITDKTKAIMVVHPFGYPADMATVMEIANERGLFVLEDAACAIGAERDGRRCGAWGHAACFSFHPRKIITTGEGGMITTNDDRLAEKMRLLATHGGIAANGIGLSFVANGFNYRLSEIQAAIGLSQMKRLDDILEDRRRTAQGYRDRLHGLDYLTIPADYPGGLGTYQSLVTLLNGDIDRNAVIAEMRAAGIETTLGTYAMHSHPAFAQFGYAPGALPHAYFAQEHSLTLPLLPRMPEAMIDRVTDTLKAILTARAG